LIITGSTGGNAAAFPDTNNSPSSTWPALTITTAAPEPGTFSLLGFAALAVVFTRRPRKRA
jgi:hypothetical protein